jgi:hypothetical protein
MTTSVFNSWASSSSFFTPIATASLNAAKEFYGAWAEAPLWAIIQNSLGTVICNIGIDYLLLVCSENLSALYMMLTNEVSKGLQTKSLF